MKTFGGYLLSRYGGRVDFDAVPPASCIDLVNDYMAAQWGAPRYTGNAVDIPRQPRTGWTWVSNGPKNYPPRGAVVCWHPNVSGLGIGPYAHTAVAVWADANLLISLDQGWPEDAPANLILHTYTGVAGWWQRSP